MPNQILFLISCILLMGALGVHADTAATSPSGIPDSEQQGILALSRALSGVSGNSSDPCEWVGITCGTVNDTLHITGLVFNATASMNGTFPALGLQPFPYLTIFKINYQYDITSHIPSFGSNPELLEIYISATSFYGKIPFNHFQNNTKLQTLVLSWNDFTGSLPDLSYCRDLRTLDIGWNYFKGPPSDISMLTNLTYIDYENNRLTGPIPVFETNIQLTYVSLGTNEFTIPSNIFPNYCHLTQLQSLKLSSLRIQSTLPPSFACFSQLQTLEVQNNAMSGELDRNIFASNTQLQSLFLSVNKFSGILPTFYNCTHLRALYLSDNQFQLPILPHTFRNDRMILLDLSNNKFQGTLPIDVLPHNVTKLWLTNNQFNGTLSNDPFPASQFPVLDLLAIRGNQFSGALPAFPTTHMLSFLFAAKNQFTGSLPSTLPARNIYLSSNQLTGPIPTWYGSSDTIQLLDLSHNMLTGPLPSFASSHATNIDISFNLIDGNVENAHFICPINDANIVNIACNRMNGSVCSTWNKMNIRCYDGIHDCGYCPNPLPTMSPPSSSSTGMFSSSSTGMFSSSSTGATGGGISLTSHTCLMLILVMSMMGMNLI